MASNFHLSIVTPDRMCFDGIVEKVIVRTTDGDVGILKGHVNFIAAVSTGALRLMVDGKWRAAAVSGGFIKVQKDDTTIVANVCEWEDEIDIDRARQAELKAREQLSKKLSENEMSVAEQKLKRALNRMNVAG